MKGREMKGRGMKGRGMIGGRLAILRAMVAIGLKRAVQYRTEFALEGGLAILTIASQLVPLAVVFGARDAVAGWSHGQVLVLLGWFVVVGAILQGVVVSSFAQAIDGVRTGQFDYLLLKPVDPLFMAAIVNLRPWRLIDVAAGIALAAWGLADIGRWPGTGDALLATLLGLCALVTAFSLYVFAVAASFTLVRIENLMSVLTGLLDFGRWPIQVFEGAWRIVFTLVLPLAIVTSYPAMALLGTLAWPQMLLAVAVASAFAAAARMAWTRAIARYGSASS